ncbi:MAG: adenylyl-sulfate kinase [Marmoricola sp.]
MPEPTSQIPQHCPSPRELDDLELLVNGGLAPRTGYDAAGPITLALPDEVAVQTAAAGAVELVDPEGLALARVANDGTVTSLAPHEAGAFRRLHLSPGQVHEAYDGALSVPVAGPLTDVDLTMVGERRDGRTVLLLALTGAGTPQGVTPVGLLRASLAAADLLGDTQVVAVPLASHGDPDVDHQLGQQVVANYAPGDVLAVTGTGDLPDQIDDLVASDQPGPDEQGLVIFLTGLSGSGKSTLARALHDLLLEDGRRTVTSLDGDVVRRNLSAGLTFSKADRETNIRRIGWVAAEISRHRGIAICSPIAPFEETRQQVRDYVEQAGGAFFLVHVATPLEECERRDKKGLYAKARRGEIAEFTGISSPYDEPREPAVRVDTTGRTVEDVLGEVLDALADAGHLHLTGEPVEQQRIY